MPKVPGMSKAQQNAMVADAMAEPGAEPIDVPVPETPTRDAEWPAPPGGVAVANPVASAGVNPEFLAMMQMFITAMQQNGTDVATAIREGLAGAQRQARAPIPETYVSGGYPAKSVFSHPDGDLKTPRTKLHCPMFLGVYDEHGKVSPAFEIFQDVCTEKERVLLNVVQPGEYVVDRNDGKQAKCKVVVERDALGGSIRQVFAFPQTWLSKEEQAQMPAQVRFLQQMTEAAPAA